MASNFANFKLKGHFQHTIVIYIVNYVQSQEKQTDKILNVFTEIDDNNNGTLQFKELHQFYMRLEEDE